MDVVPQSYARAADDIIEAKKPHIQAGKVLNFEAVKQWFMPRYAKWKKDASRAVTVEEVVAFINSSAAWVVQEQKPMA